MDSTSPTCVVPHGIGDIDPVEVLVTEFGDETDITVCFKYTFKRGSDLNLYVITASKSIAAGLRAQLHLPVSRSQVLPLASFATALHLPLTDELIGKDYPDMQKACQQHIHQEAKLAMTLPAVIQSQDAEGSFKSVLNLYYILEMVRVSEEKIILWIDMGKGRKATPGSGHPFPDSVESCQFLPNSEKVAIWFKRCLPDAFPTFVSARDFNQQGLSCSVGNRWSIGRVIPMIDSKKDG